MDTYIINKYILLFFISFPALADEMIIHTYSYHIGQREWLKSHEGFNERNYGLGIKTKDYITGVYYSTESKPCLYITKYKDYNSITLSYGAVLGYSGFPVLPTIQASYTMKNISISAIPSLTPKLKPIVTLHAALRFEI